MPESDIKQALVPVMGFVGYSGSGKTTLLRRIITEFSALGTRCAVVKHAHHQFDIDTPGKDSYLLRQAGAVQTMVASRHRWALMVETADAAQEPLLGDLLARLDYTQLDVVFVEGFKHASYPKVEIHRTELNKPLLYPNDPDIIALITNSLPAPANTRKIPLLDLDNLEQIVQFIVRSLDLSRIEK